MAQPRKVLIIAYLFPPIGGGGVQRAVKMARYLGEFGWQVHVLTVEPQYHATLDESLLEEIPDDVIIHRCREDQGLLNKLRPVPNGSSNGSNNGVSNGTASNVSSASNASNASSESSASNASNAPSESSALYASNASSESNTSDNVVPNRIKASILQFLKMVKNAALIPDDQILWYPSAKRMALEIVREHGIDAIFSTSGPYTNHLVARYLKRKTGLPWIADFRDPWTQNMHRSSIKTRNWIEDRLEKSVHQEANMTLTVTHSFARNFNEKFGAAISRLEVIHNGYDPADYEDLKDVRKLPEDEDRCVFIYAGIFYQARNPRYLLRAVKQLIDEGVIERDRILLRFAGVFDYPGYSENIDAVRELELSDIVEIMGNLPHKQALTAMKQSDVLLLVGDTAPGSGDYIPGKLFEYLAIGHPILALSLPGESTKIIEKYGLGETANPLSIEEIKQAVTKLYDRWKQEQLKGLKRDLLGKSEDEGEGVGEDRRDPRDDVSGLSGQDDPAASSTNKDKSQPPSTLMYQRREQARLLANLLNEITGSRL